MKVLLVENYYYPYISGITESTKLLAENLAARKGFEVAVLCSNHDKLPKEEIKVFGDEINEIAKAVNSRGFVKDEEIHRIIELEKCLLEVLREVDIIRSSDYNDSIN